jgi:nicotinamide riboside kinase
MNTPVCGRPHRAFCVAVLGAESTGKTTLAQALAEALTDPSPGTSAASPAQPVGTGLPGKKLRTGWVPEVLRQWCREQGRTPQAHEQAAIMEAQHRQIEAAARQHELVVCDTTAVMTAVYSECIFGDRSLHLRAAQLHRTMDLTLLMALDLPWVADAHLRDGPQMQQPVDQALRQLLAQNRLPFTVVSGRGAARLQ